MGEGVDIGVRLIPLFRGRLSGIERDTTPVVAIQRAQVPTGVRLWWDEITDRATDPNFVPKDLTAAGAQSGRHKLLIEPIACVPPRGLRVNVEVRCTQPRALMPPMHVRVAGRNVTEQRFGPNLLPRAARIAATLSVEDKDENEAYDAQVIHVRATEKDNPEAILGWAALKYEGKMPKDDIQRSIRPILGSTAGDDGYHVDASATLVRFSPQDPPQMPSRLLTRRPSTKNIRMYVSLAWGSVPRGAARPDVRVRWFATDERGCELGDGEPGAHALPVRFTAVSTNEDITFGKELPIVTFDAKEAAVWADISSIQRSVRGVRFYVAISGLGGTDYGGGVSSSGVVVPVCEVDLGPNEQGACVPGNEAMDADMLGVLYLNGWRITVNQRNELEFAHRVFEDEPWRVAHAIPPPST
jgi:hypothetical protein